MTAWELQLAANAHGKSSATMAWMTAALSRSKKMKPLAEMLEPYDSFKLDEDREQEIKGINAFQYMMARAKSQQQAQDEPEKGKT